MTHAHEILTRITERREIIAKRRREIANAIETLRSEDAGLVGEDAELEIMVRRLPSYAVNEEREPQALGNMVASLVAAIEPEPERKKRKPDGIPPILEMANEALAHFEAQGTQLVTARDIAKFMRARYWPEAKADYIQGQLWRAAKRGDLIKKGSCYSRPNYPRARAQAQNAEGLATVIARPSLSNGETGLHPVEPRGDRAPVRASLDPPASSLTPRP